MTRLETLAEEAVSALDKPGGGTVEQLDVKPVNAKEQRSLYAKRVKVHPKRASGTFRRIKWIVMAVTLGIYYFGPWIRWDRGPDAPNQAILIDFPARRFYFFFIEIWPQEVYYITGLLILAALALFLVTSLAGRVWCGYSCPQTVWTDLFVTVERWVEGDRNARMKLDRAPWTASKIGKRVTKHGIWLLIAILTGGAWVFYFADAPTLGRELLTFQAPAAAYGFIGLFTATTYLLGGIAREQVCTFMCPWPRIQGAMFDEESLLVTYRTYRGEPRGKHKKGDSWEGRGDCVACRQCVAVCPMGIDIRDGPQLECIQCALCIDACNDVMKKVGRPLGLIAYDTPRRLEAEAQGEPPPLPRLIRARTLLYAALMLAVGSVMLFALVTRSDLEVNLLRDRNPLYVTLSDGALRNGYTLKILNKAHQDRTFDVTVEGLDGAELSGVGLGEGASLQVDVKPDRLRAVKIFVTAAQDQVPGGDVDVTFKVRDRASGVAVTSDTSFRGPK
ncbi:MAG TPA: cytochrome c oxidase accessory protein CcoG [Kiloniellaceae bacterium]|nr:cytochrome c oxidase accessory protein CcoG [Kiloniellaceae bacterium]